MRGFLRVVLVAAMVALAVGLMGAGQAEGGHLVAVAVPYHAGRAGAGTLTLEILDPEDKVLGRMETAAKVADGEGVWRESVRPEREVPLTEMAWERLRWRFIYGDGNSMAMEGTAAMSAVLRRPVVRVLGQSEYMAGSKAAVRVIVSDSSSEAVANGTVRVDLETDKGKTTRLFTGRLNRRGTVEAKLEFPAGLVGGEKLHFYTTTALGEAEYTEAIHVQDKAQILLTTEKPIYQPGQTIHVRALALDRASHTATANKPLTFELEDSKGNKVFRRATETDGFGIAAADFGLADEVNLGTYHLRAVMGDAGSSNRAEMALNVQRYVLPKFKVAVEFDQKSGKVKRDFRPGEHVTGTVRANYFYGQAVGKAEVEVKTKVSDVNVFDAATVKGKTDGDGVFHFDMKLPNFVAGWGLTQGAARALVEASVKDSAAHTEVRGEAITISQSALLVNAVPEGGQLVPRLENQVFVLTSYPDGTPAVARVSVKMPDGSVQSVETDASGVGVVRMMAGVGRQTLKFDADDRHGSKATAEVNLDARTGVDQVLLRASRAVFKAGDRIQLKVVSTRRTGTAYVDVVKAGQTLLTRDIDMQNGEGELTLTATPEMAGTLDMDAYVFGRDAQPVMDHRLVFVQPADELKIETASDKAVYRPGDDARIRFHVTNTKGEGVSAALGLEIVDEAVFALAEKQPGFAKTFFYLEQEVMKPRYEIHSMDMGRVVDPCGNGDTCELAARALFSATEIAAPTRVNVEFGRELPVEARRAEFRGRYEQALATYVQKVVATLPLKGGSRDLVGEFSEAAVDGGHPRDAWGRALIVTRATWQQRAGTKFYLVRSAGANGKFGDEDDLTAYIQETEKADGRREGDASNRMPTRTGSEPEIEHDWGSANGLAEVTGSVADPSGAMISGTTITLRDAGTGKVRTTHADRDGRFTLSGVPVGRYRLTMTKLGFDTEEQEFVVEARDRVVVSARLAVGSENTVVEVSATNGNLQTMNETVTVMAGMAVDAVASMPMVNRDVTRFAMARGMAAPPPPAAKMPMTLKAKAAGGVEEAKANGGDTHVRSYFPEALYINPEILTDGHGNASISVPMADSITTWRMAMLASTQGGALGTGTGSLKVFQDFFVDLDMPLTLTQGDKVSIPVGVFNYSGKAGKATLKLEQDAWYTLDDAGEKTVQVESNQPGAASFTVNANRIGRFKLMLKAHMDGNGKDAGRDDIVVREIDVVPNGKEQNAVFNGRLDKTAEQTLQFPAAAIPDASSVLVRLYPGPLSQVIEGMDGVLRMPGGCFEQTSSSTYPNVLALDYMKRTKKLTPEVHAKAEGYIANGYQRLLTFEVPGGGFSWFGQAPANKILTAYGLMEFSDMAKVSDVDPRLIARTQEWLARQQQGDGSWRPDTQFINEGATNRFNSDVLRITAYLGWGLVDTGYGGAEVGKAKGYVEGHLSGKVDAYTLAVIANFAVETKDREFTRMAMQALLDARVEKGDQVWWTAAETGMYSSGESAAVETTGLAVQALLKWGEATEVARKGLGYITSKKMAGGNWGTTQATIMALRAMVLASDATGANTRGTVKVMVDGKVEKTLELTGENNDLLHQFVFKQTAGAGRGDVRLEFAGTGGLSYQIVGRYFTPWGQERGEALGIDVTYDRTTLAKDAIATATATIKSHMNGTAKMVMVDLGIPPGFELLTEDLQEMQEKTAGQATGRLEKFQLTATQAILYLNAVGAEQTVTVKFRLRAKYPMRAKNFQSKVYEYYDPGVGSVARPVQFTVTK